MSDTTTINDTATKSSIQETVGDKFTSHTSFHYNLDQDVLVVTEDRFRLRLNEYRSSLLSNRNWINPLLLLISLLLMFSTSDFHDRFYISSNTWQAVFLIITAGSCVWLFYTIYKAATNKMSVDKFVASLKTPNKQP